MSSTSSIQKAFTNMPYTCPKSGTMTYEITTDTQVIKVLKNSNTVASFTNYQVGGSTYGSFTVSKGDVLSYSLGDRIGHNNGVGVILAYNN